VKASQMLLYREIRQGTDGVTQTSSLKIVVVYPRNHLLKPAS